MEAYTDQALTNMSQLWKNEDDSLIIPRLLPRVPVQKNSGTFPIWGKEALVIQQDLLRTGKSKTREVGISRRTGTWGPLQERALKTFISRDDYRIYKTPFDAESAGLLVIKEQMALAEEYAGARVLTDTSVIANNTTLTSANKFSVADVDPIATITTAAKAFKRRAFKRPNTMAIGEDAWFALCEHPMVRENFQYVQAPVVGEAEILRLLAPYGIKQIFVGSAQGTLSDTENPDDEPEYADIWGDNVLLTFVTPRPELQSVNGGYTLFVEGEAYVDKWEVRDPKGTYVRQNDYYDQVIFSTDVYYLIADVL